MGLLLGGSVLTVFELLDLIVFRFANTLCGKQQKPDAEAADGGQGCDMLDTCSDVLGCYEMVGRRLR